MFDAGQEVFRRGQNFLKARQGGAFECTEGLAMRAVFGIVSLVVVLLVVMMLARQQMTVVQPPAVIASGPVVGAANDRASAPLNAAEQSRQELEAIFDNAAVGSHNRGHVFIHLHGC